jgi:hypothetical protein
MDTDRPSTGDEDLSVRLRWPSEQGDADRQSTPDADPGPAAEAPVHRAEVVAASDAGRPGHSLIEAYDRLGDRVLERMRSLREDVDADLAAVRSELASLRQAVDDVGDRVQLRQLRATIDELRGDVSGLRRAVLEWPELEQVSGDVAGLRSDMSALLEASRNGVPAPSGEGLQLGALAPLVEEVAALRGEVAALRRRIALRVDGAAPVGDDQLEHLADQVAERMAVRPAKAAAGRARRR